MIVHLKTPIMAVKIRLQRRGRKKRPFYHIVIADSRSPRDGRFIEKVGTYNPMTKPATIELDQDKAFDWLMKGAQPTDTARAILRFKGVLYRKHLARGVRKEALTQEQADAKLNEWMAVKEERIAKRVEESRQELEDFYTKLSGTAPAPAAEEAPAEETPVAEAAPEGEAPQEEAPNAPEAPAAEEGQEEEQKEE